MCDRYHQVPGNMKTTDRDDRGSNGVSEYGFFATFRTNFVMQSIYLAHLHTVKNCILCVHEVIHMQSYTRLQHKGMQHFVREQKRWLLDFIQLTTIFFFLHRSVFSRRTSGSVDVNSSSKAFSWLIISNNINNNSCSLTNSLWIELDRFRAMAFKRGIVYTGFVRLKITKEFMRKIAENRSHAYN